MSHLEISAGTDIYNNNISISEDARGPANVASHIYGNSEDGFWHIREATQREENQVTDEIESERIPSLVSVGEKISGPDAHGSPEYRAIIDGDIYSTDNIKNPVSNTGRRDVVANGCEEDGLCCAADLMLAYPHCALGAWACSGAGPGGLACVVAFVNLCLPSAALVTISGCCEAVYNNCV